MKPSAKYAALACALLFSCRRDTSPPPDMGYGYFPDEAGRWIIYQVDSTIYDFFTKSVYTRQWQVKEFTESVFTDNENRPTLRIVRYKRPDDTSAWAISDVWFANRTLSTAERVEENVRYIRLVFPVKRDRTWNGNAFNTLEEWDYKYTDTDAPATVNGIAFDSTAAILQRDEESLIAKQYYLEQYAKNVGMIYKEVIDVKDSSSSSNPAVPILQKANTGYALKMQVVSYGK